MKKTSQEITEKDIEKVIDTPDIVPMSVPVKDHVIQVVQSHSWRQIGASLECVSCEAPHGTHIGTGQILTGIDSNGNPILEKVKLQEVSPAQKETK